MVYYYSMLNEMEKIFVHSVCVCVLVYWMCIHVCVYVQCYTVFTLLPPSINPYYSLLFFLPSSSLPFFFFLPPFFFLPSFSCSLHPHLFYLYHTTHDLLPSFPSSFLSSILLFFIPSYFFVYQIEHAITLIYQLEGVTEVFRCRMYHHNVLSYPVLLCHTIPRHVISHVVLCYVILCSVM